MTRPWVWLQVVLGWLPVWGLYTLMVSPVNPIHGKSPAGFAALSALIAVALAAALGVFVQRLVRRWPWPHPIRPGFLALHVAAAVVYSVAWVALKGLAGLLLQHQAADIHYLLLPNLILGVWLYAMVAGVGYAIRSTERAAQAEASAARAQLAALRGQLNPHFLFNALHTVVQLIPEAPAEAARAAEQIAGLLRTTLEEGRDLLPLAEERAFVERYLELERVRFGDRLRVRVTTTPEADAALVPCFALQTLVENAVRHGAAPRIEPTEIRIDANAGDGRLRLTVADSGKGASAAELQNGGTGLLRLRERLAVLYGGEGRLELGNGTSGGLTATLVLPLDGPKPAG